MSDTKISGLAKVVEIVRLLVALMPAIITLVQQFEALLPQSGQGQAKLAAIRETLQGVFAEVSDAALAFGDVWPTIERFIGATVRTLNAAGVFRKG